MARSGNWLIREVAIVMLVVIGAVSLGAALVGGFLIREDVRHLQTASAEAVIHHATATKCSLHDVIVGERTVLLSLRDILRPPKGAPDSAALKDARHKISRRLNELVPPTIQESACDPAPS